MSDKKSILIVDDDAALMTALTKKFEDKGYTVTSAEDGSVAIEAMNKQVFDVILTDLHMPDKDGFSVLEEMKKTQNADIPAYVITNLGSDKFCEKALELGAKQCFVKSIVTLRDVVQIVDAQLGA